MKDKGLSKQLTPAVALGKQAPLVSWGPVGEGPEHFMATEAAGSKPKSLRSDGEGRPQKVHVGSSWGARLWGLIACEWQGLDDK